MTATRVRAGARTVRPQEFTLGQITRHLIENLGPKLTAFIVERDVQTVTRWARDQQTPPQDEVERKLRATFDVLQLLLSAGDSRHVVRAWFVGMNPQLDDASPAESMAAGHLREVMAAARAFAAGG